MKAPLPEVLMVLAVKLLGQSRREWAQAILVEFEVARSNGEGLAFASGCVLAALGQMLKHAEGRSTLADYALALGLLIPMAAFQFASAFGLASTVEGPLSEGIFLPTAASNPFVSYPQVSALPCLLVLWLLLGLGHLRLAWVLVECDWAQVMKTSALIGATSVTLIMFMSTLLLDITPMVLHSAAMAVELTALLGAARRHERLTCNALDGAAR